MPAPAPLSTSTSWPWATYSRTAPGVSPSRYSLFLISLGQPTRICRTPFGASRHFSPAVTLGEAASNVLANAIARGSTDKYFLHTGSRHSQEIRIMSLDRIDVAILDALQKDGRMSNAALAERVGLSQSACSR